MKPVEVLFSVKQSAKINEKNQYFPIGPMVYSAFFCDENQMSILKDLGCAGRFSPLSCRTFDLFRSFFRFETINRRTSINDFQRISTTSKQFGLCCESSFATRHIDVHVKKVKSNDDCQTMKNDSLIFCREKYNLNDMSHGE